MKTTKKKNTTSNFEIVKNQRLKHALSNWDKISQNSQKDIVSFIFEEWLIVKEILFKALDLMSPLNSVLVDSKTLRKELSVFDNTNFNELAIDYLNNNFEDIIHDYDIFDIDYVNEKWMDYLKENLEEILAQRIINEVEKLIVKTKKNIKEQ